MNESDAPPGRARTVAARPQRRPQPQKYCTCGTSRQFSALPGPSRPVVAQRQACQARHAQQGQQPPRTNILQLRNVYGLPTRRDHGELSLRHEREADDLRWTATAGPPQRCLANGTRRTNNGHVHSAQELHLWESPEFSARLDHHLGRLYDLHNKDVDHFVQQQWNLFGPTNSLDHGKRPLHHDRKSARPCPRNCNWGISTVLCAV